MQFKSHTKTYRQPPRSLAIRQPGDVKLDIILLPRSFPLRDLRSLNFGINNDGIVME